MTKQISEDRKAKYKLGLTLQIVGGCLFACPFIVLPIIIVAGIIGGEPGGFMILAPLAFVAAFIGFALIAGGGFIRTIAARGTAGSGLVLDPEKAKEDLEPWTRMAGGMTKDFLDEADINLSGLGQGEKVIMIRCQYCQKLNEEDSKFCQECGKPI